jgi:3-oxoacyl-[acyl-carrier protein] reductase
VTLEDGAFVVGGTTPFGLAVARELVDHGARVLLVGPRLETLEAVVEELGDQAVPCVADLADAEDTARVGGVAAALLGGVDGVVLTAAVAPEGDAFNRPASEWVTAFARSVWGPLGLLRGIVPLLDEGGAVVYVVPAASGEGEAGRVFRSMLEALAEELASILPSQIRVGRVEADPDLAEAAVRLLAPQ